MVKAILKMTLVALLGSVIIVLLAQLIRPTHIPPPIESIATWAEQHHALGPATLILRDKLLWGEARNTRAVAPDEAPLPAAGVSYPAASSRRQSPGRPGPLSTRKQPKRSQTRSPASTTPTWAIASAPKTKVYSMNGTFLQNVRAGTIVLTGESKKTDAGTVITCRAPKMRAEAPSFLIQRDDLDLQYTDYGSTDPERIASLVRLSRVKAELAARLSASREGPRKDNPHYTQYAATREAYYAYWKKVKALEKQRTNGQGDAHMRAADELRKLKGEDIRVGNAYEEAKQAYEAWNAAHPAPPPDDNPAIQALRKQLTQLQAQLNQKP